MYIRLRIKYWWSQKGSLWIARHLPSRIVLWCYILVTGLNPSGPSDNYKVEYDLWVEKKGLKEFV